MSKLIDEINESGHDIDKLYGDSAYCNFKKIKKREKEGMEFCAKTRKAVNIRGLFTKDDFKIDLKNGTVTCSAKQIKKFNGKKSKEKEKNMREMPVA